MPYGPPPQPKKSGMSGCLIAFLVVLGVLIVGGIVAAVLFATVLGTAVNELGESVTIGEPAGGIGDTVRDGQFEFVVNSFECSDELPGFESFGGLEGLGEPDTGVTTTAPEMKYCVANLDVKNVGDKARPFTGTEQRLYETPDGEPYIGIQNYLSPDEPVIDELAPGQSTQTDVVFTVPRSFKPAFLDLHDFWTSGGVTVSVG